MTMDRSLRVRAGLVRSRSVLTRAERIERLRDLDCEEAVFCLTR